jgi:hypothetical protein
MRRPIVAVVVAAAALLVACGGGGGDDEAREVTTTTATTERDPVDVSTPQAVVSALASAGITCSDLVDEGGEVLAAFGINGTESVCMVDGRPLWMAHVVADEDLSAAHALFIQLVDGTWTDDAGQPITTLMWVEVAHTIVGFRNATAADNARLPEVQAALGGAIESVSAVP